MDSSIIGPSLIDVFTALEYQDDKGLVTTNTADIESGRIFVWEEVSTKLEMDAAYFHGNVPVVYFKRFNEFNNDKLWKLHRSLWNHNRAPLLIAVLPNEVRIYNCFTPPTRTPDEFAVESSVLLKKEPLEATNLLAFKKNLSEYKRREITTGKFAKTKRRRFKPKNRVDERLLDNLRSVRRHLIDKGLTSSLANRLIGRCIFISYLKDRGILKRGNHTLFDDDSSFEDLLMNSKKDTYQLFEKLSHRFNGDLFPVDDTERREVELSHLQDLGRFFTGDDMSSGQMHFWPYDFNFIPIELISGIYETFLDEIRDETSAHYTPPQIVDFVLDDLLSDRKKAEKTKILDPACGSGIFLIEAYRRLVTLNSHPRRKWNFEKLRDLLTESIYGVDINEDAVEVAIFSCCLALLDSLGPDDIPDNMQLPNLKNNNLFVSDFFDLEAEFNRHSYDIIVGNPPWKKKLTNLAQEFIDQDRYPVGDKQIAQAFLWRAPALLADNGQICLLCPSKSTLYNRRNRHKEFRQEFFKRHQVTKIVDFSEFRRALFRKSKAPMVAVFYQNGSVADGNHVITHIGLHRSLLSEVLAGIVIYGDETKPISYRQAIHNSNIWKIALWGTPRDLAFIDDLKRRFPTLEKVIEKRKWKTTLGVQGGKKEYAPHLKKMRFVPTENIEHFFVSSGKDCSIQEDHFERKRKVELFRGPFVLIRRGITGKGVLKAAFLPDDALFKNSVYAISGPQKDADYLKFICACINSSLARYYHFLTASSWGVERSEISWEEHKEFPCPIPDKNDSIFNEVVSLVDHVQQNGLYDNWRSDLDKLICKIYDLTPSEQNIMEDFTETVIDLHHSGTKSNAYKPPLVTDLQIYAQTYKDVFASMTRKSGLLKSFVHEGDSAYRAVSFSLASENLPRQSGEPASDLDDHLTNLEKIAIEQHGESSYLLKNIRVYEGKKIHFMKPGEQRFWTRLAAYNDADDTISDLLRVDNP